MGATLAGSKVVYWAVRRAVYLVVEWAGVKVIGMAVTWADV